MDLHLYFCFQDPLETEEDDLVEKVKKTRVKSVKRDTENVEEVDTMVESRKTRSASKGKIQIRFYFVFLTLVILVDYFVLIQVTEKRKLRLWLNF